MKGLFLALAVAGAFSAPAFATPDDQTMPLVGNVFPTYVSTSSGSINTVRVGVQNNIPSVVFNAPGYVPVVLGNVAGALTYNGVAIATSAFVGDSMSVVLDLAVGRDAAVTRNATVGGTLGVTGASTLAAVGATTMTLTGSFIPKANTLAELNALAPGAANEYRTCSNCLNRLAVSTGTAAGAWTTVTSSTTHIN